MPGGLLSVRSLVTEFETSRLTDTTDANGRAAVQVQLGVVAGEQGVEVKVPSLGVADTARYTAQPGAPDSIAFASPDTAVTFGTSYTPAFRVLDLWRNVRSGDPVVLSILEGAAQLTLDGSISATEPTRVTVLATSGGVSDTAHVSFVPPGAFAAVRSVSGQFQLVTMRFDGTGASTLASLKTANALPVWAADGSRVVYQDLGDGSDTRSHLYSVTTQGVRTPVLPAAAFTGEANPSLTADGQWVYFAGAQGTSAWNGYWRAHLDGSSVQQLSVIPTVYAPEVSPSGNLVAYATWDVTIDDAGISVVDPATGSTTPLVSGNLPSWSYDGARIAYIGHGGALSLMNADGTAARVVSTEHLYGVTYGVSARPSWSSDGSWLLMRGPGRLELVNVATGAVVPLPYAVDLFQPAVKR